MDPEAGDFKRAALPTHGELNFGVCCHGVKSSGFCSVNRSPTASWLFSFCDLFCLSYENPLERRRGLLFVLI